MTEALFDRRYSVCTIEIKKDEDWYDAVRLKRKMADGSESDFDFNDVAHLELYIRPRFDHATSIRTLSSTLDGGNELQFNPATPGILTIYVARSNVIASLPVGQWDHFLVATRNDGVTYEIWRGPLIVHPGKIS